MILKIRFSVDNLADTMSLFDQVKVYRATSGIASTYTEVTDVDSRIRLSAITTDYVYTDLDGARNYWYKTAFYNSSSAKTGELSEPHIGADTATDNIITLKELKEIYLFGVDLTNDRGEPYPDRLFEWGILFAIDWAERELDIKIRPTQYSWEKHDYYRLDYQQWMFLKTHHAPIIDDLDGVDLATPHSDLTRVRVVWPNGDQVVEFDQRWLQLREDSGHINIVPVSAAISNVLMTAGGNFLPLTAGGIDFVPNMIQVQYTAGFREGAVPYSIRELIGKKASFGPLNIAGDLIAGAGIASQSVSMDGLSQSISTTSSATNSGYGARLGQYAKEIKEQLPTLRRNLKGIPMGVA